LLTFAFGHNLERDQNRTMRLFKSHLSGVKRFQYKEQQLQKW